MVNNLSNKDILKNNTKKIKTNKYKNLTDNNNDMYKKQLPNGPEILEEKLQKNENITINQDKLNDQMDKKINIYENNVLENIVVIPGEENNHELYGNKINLNNYGKPYDFINMYDYPDNYRDDNVPLPIPSKTDILIGDEIDDFEIFKNEILSDKSIDNDLRHILIMSRMEQIEKFNAISKNNIENSICSSKIAPLICRLKNTEYKKITSVQKEYLLDQIVRWTEGKIQKIKLESDTLYEINELIDLIKSVRPDTNDLEIKNIFEPKNIDDYNCFMETMEIIKLESIKGEQKRINKKLEKKKLEEEEEKKRMDEIGLRKNLLEIVFFNLNKLSSVDLETRNLRTILELPISKFMGLETELIELEENLAQQIKKFINSIRINKENKDNILNRIKIIT